MEIKLRQTLETIYFGKTKEVKCFIVFKLFLIFIQFFCFHFQVANTLRSHLSQTERNTRSQFQAEVGAAVGRRPQK